MNFDKILQKPFLISVFVFNIILFGVIVFLLGYVQNLLDSDSRNNLEEIVSQNKNVITSKLLLDLNRLDIISNKISDGLKNKNITKEADINKFLEDYSKNSIDDWSAAMSGIDTGNITLRRDNYRRAMARRLT